MILQSILLQNFRSYTKSTFDFSPNTTVIIGANTSGKTNLCESIYLLATGNSFRTDKDVQMIDLDKEIARITGIINNNEITKLEVMLAQGSLTGGKFSKKFLVNGVAKRKIDFAGIIPTVIFSPEELEIIIAGPSLRRKFLNDVLIQVDREYRVVLTLYEKALRQRNALLNDVQETGSKNPKQFEYWDELLIKNGQIVTIKRQEFLDYINSSKKDIFKFKTIYDHSVISKERLEQYANAEIASGVTLVGPHRDDFIVTMDKDLDIRYFGSRGQQRLVVLQLKMLQISYIEKILGQRPLLILDDIFSELDEGHINLVLSMLNKQQTIITTTHKEFIKGNFINNFSVIELEL